MNGGLRVVESGGQAVPVSRFHEAPSVGTGKKLNANDLRVGYSVGLQASMCYRVSEHKPTLMELGAREAQPPQRGDKLLLECDQLCVPKQMGG